MTALLIIIFSVIVALCVIGGFVLGKDLREKFDEWL